MKNLAHEPDVVDDKVVELSRQKTAAEITEIVSRLFSETRDRLKAYLRHQHPEWTEAELQAELIRRIHGSI